MVRTWNALVKHEEQAPFKSMENIPSHKNCEQTWLHIYSMNVALPQSGWSCAIRIENSANRNNVMYNQKKAVRIPLTWPKPLALNRWYVGQRVTHLRQVCSVEDLKRTKKQMKGNLLAALDSGRSSANRCIKYTHTSSISERLFT